MIVLLLPLVAAILIFVEPPPKYGARAAKAKEARAERVIQVNAKGEEKRGSAMPETRTDALQERAKGLRERGSAIQEWAKGLQERLYGRLEAGGLKGDELATVGALTLGYKEELGKELKRHFQASGAAHVLAVSGLHTGIIYGILLGFLTLGGRYKPLYENRLGRRALSMTVIGVMWFYALLTGMTPSVVRAVLMVTIFEIGRMAYRQAFSLNTIAAAAVLILIVKPTDLWSVSFQLSFAATTAIVALVGGGAFSINRYLGLSKYRDRIWGKAIVYFLGIIVVSVAAQLGTLPITMCYFGQISNYFLLTNMIVLPVASFLVPSGLISIALGGSSAGVLFSKATKGLAWVMNHSVEWIESLPGSTTHVSIGLGMVAIYYVLFIGLCAAVKGEK